MIVTQDVFDKHFLWLATHDTEFMRKFSNLIYPETFENAEERWLLQHALDYWNKHSVVIEPDALTIMLSDKPDDPKFDKEGVVDLYDAEAPSESLRSFLIEKSDEFLRKERSRMIMGEYIETMKHGSWEEALSVLNKGVTELSQTTEGEEDFELIEDPDAVIAAIASMFDDDGRAIPTGVPGIDAILQGGGRPGELLVYLAPPGHGKSHWLVSCSREAWLNNKNVLYVSLEMAKERVAARLYAGVAGRDSSEVHQHGSVLKTRLAAIKKNGIESDVWVKRWPAQSVTVADIISYVKQLQEKKGMHIDMVVVDYADELRPVRHSDRGRVDDQATVYRELRAMAIMLEIPIWTASQANRAALRKKTITIENLADSFDKAKIADFILAQCQTAAEKSNNRVRLFTAKVRNNGDGQFVHCLTDFSRSGFYETDPEFQDEEEAA